MIKQNQNSSIHIFVVSKVSCIMPFMLVTFLLFSCRSPANRSQVETLNESPNQIDPVVYAQKREKIEQDEIQNRIDHQKEKYQTNGKGYWYYLINKGKSPADYAKKGDVVTYTYKVSNLAGKPLYDFESIGMQTHWVDKQSSIRVLESALKDLPLGSHSRLIVSSFSAYGPRGDGDRIGPYTPLIIELKMIDIKKQSP